MAQTIGVVDPWSGMYKGVETLRQAASAADERKLNEIKMQIAKQQIDEANRQAETRKGLAGIYSRKNEMMPEEYQVENPEYATSQQSYQQSLKDYEAQNEAYQGIEGIRAAIKANPMESQLNELQLAGAEQDYQKRFGNINAPVMPVTPTTPKTITQTRMVPRYNQSDIQKDVVEYLSSRGDWAGLKGIESVADVTSKIGDRQQKLVTGMFNTIKAMKQSGFDDASIKSALKQQAENLNRLQGAPVIDIKAIDSMKINNVGDLMIQDIGGGQSAVTAVQPNGTLSVHIVDTTKEQRLALGYKNLELARQRVSQGWTRLNPAAASALEFAKQSGGEAAKKLYKDNDAYSNAIEGNKILSEATDILNKDPANIAGWSAKLMATIGSIHQELEAALNSGDRKAFSRLMMSNADTFKKLFGPQISNADADLMFKLTGATATSEAEIRAAIRTLRSKNDNTIRDYEHILKGATGATPQAKPFVPAQGNKPVTATDPRTGKKIYLNSTGTGWVDAYGRPVK